MPKIISKSILDKYFSNQLARHQVGREVEDDGLDSVSKY